MASVMVAATAAELEVAVAAEVAAELEVALESDRELVQLFSNTSHDRGFCMCGKYCPGIYK